MRISSRYGRPVALGLAGVAAVGGLVAGAGPAGATAKSGAPAPARPARPAHLPSAGKASGQLQTMASQDGKCQVGDVCLYYFDSAGGYGSGYDTAHNDPDLSNNRFISAGAGRHATVTNNTEAVWNRDPNTYVTVCTGADYTENCGSVAPGELVDLNDVYRNNIESLTWADSAN